MKKKKIQHQKKLYFDKKIEKKNYRAQYTENLYDSYQIVEFELNARLIMWGKALFPTLLKSTDAIHRIGHFQ